MDEAHSLEVGRSLELGEGLESESEKTIFRRRSKGRGECGSSSEGLSSCYKTGNVNVVLVDGTRGGRTISIGNVELLRRNSRGGGGGRRVCKRASESVSTEEREEARD